MSKCFPYIHSRFSAYERETANKLLRWGKTLWARTIRLGGKRRRPCSHTHLIVMNYDKFFMMKAVSLFVMYQRDLQSNFGSLFGMWVDGKCCHWGNLLRIRVNCRLRLSGS